IGSGRVELGGQSVYPAEPEIGDWVSGATSRQVYASARVAIAAREILHAQKVAAEFERMRAANPRQRAGVLIVVEGPDFRYVIRRADGHIARQREVRRACRDRIIRAAFEAGFR